MTVLGLLKPKVVADISEKKQACSYGQVLSPQVGN
jgi:hypothetical protein